MEGHVRGLSLIEEAMKEGIAAGRLRDVDPPVLAIALFGLLRSFTEQWVLTGSKDALTPMSPVSVELFFEGARVRSSDLKEAAHRALAGATADAGRRPNVPGIGGTTSRQT